MDKKHYQQPEAELILFDSEDIVRTSGPEDTQPDFFESIFL